MTYVERPTSLIKPPLPMKPRDRPQTDRRIYGNLHQRVKLFDGLEQLSEDAAESGEEENLEPLRRHQPKAVTPDQKRWTQIDKTDNVQWNNCKSSTREGGSLRHSKPSPIPAPRKSLSPTSPNGMLLSPTFTAQGTKSDFKPRPKPRARSVTPDFLLDKEFNAVVEPHTLTPSSPSRSTSIEHRKTSDSVIYMNPTMAKPYYHTVHPLSEDRPRTRQSSMDNKFTVEEEDKPPHRPRSRSDFANGRTKEEQAQARQSVLELAQVFGGLKPAGTSKERPKTLGYPLSNGHSNKFMNSSPNLLQDHSEESVDLKSSPHKLMKSSPDLLNDHLDEEEDIDVPQHEARFGKHNQRLSKTLAGLNPIKMPAMDPNIQLKRTGNMKPPRPESTPPRPLSQIPPKPRRTYEQDVYARTKNLHQQKGTKLNVTQTMSAAPHTGRDVSPLVLPPSINTQKKRVYDDVPGVKDGEMREDNLLPSPHASPVAPKSHLWSNKAMDLQDDDDDDDKGSTNRPNSHAVGLTKRGKLQRSKRIERRSRSTEDLSFKISGEYALPETVVNIKDKNGKSNRKSEYSEVYIARSSSEESVFQQKVHDPVEDEHGYSVPGSHLWNEPVPKEQTKTGVKITALQNVMRHKIQSAFSRQRAAKVEEDTLSVTSEDSDVDLNDAVLKKRLTHVRAVKRRTSAYCSLETYRKTMQYSKLYEYVIVVSLQYNTETRRHEPCEIKRFPHEISDSQNDKLRAIPLFCFPDAFKWAKVDNYQSESYSFVLTSVDGSRLYGYNRRLLPPGNGPRLPEVYCVMSPIGCAALYNELLDEIEKRRMVSPQAVEVLLRTARDHAFPKPGERLRIKMPIGEKIAGAVTKPLVIHRPTDSRLEQMNFECLFDSLDVCEVVQVFASLLLERRVVMCSSKLSKLSSCSQAIASLLYPFAWQHVYVPVLPEKLIDMCCSPTPYIMGMLSLCIPKLDDLPGLDEVIVVDLDSRDFYFVVGDEETILPKKLYLGLQRALAFAQKGGSDNVNDIDRELAKDPESKNAMISEAFIHFFVESCGHYSDHFSSQFDGTLKFDRNGFLNAVRSRSLRRFLEVFTETQMFSLFIQEKETESEGICQGMFERRVKVYEREKANNATFSTKMKKIVKDSGLRFALPRSRHKPTK